MSVYLGSDHTGDKVDFGNVECDYATLSTSTLSRFCHCSVAVLSKVDCRWLARYRRTTVEQVRTDNLYEYL